MYNSCNSNFPNVINTVWYYNYSFLLGFSKYNTHTYNKFKKKLFDLLNKSLINECYNQALDKAFVNKVALLVKGIYMRIEQLVKNNTILQ